MSILSTLWFLLLFNSGGLRVLPNYAITVVALLVLLGLALVGKRLSRRLLLPPLVFLVSAMAINMVSTESIDAPKFYLIQFAYFLLAALFHSMFGRDVDAMISGLYSALKFHMWYAILGFVVGLILKESAHAIALYGSLQKTIGYLFYYPEVDTIPYVMRAQGLFWEPGILQYYMNLLLIMGLAKRERRIIVLSSLTVLFTVSTTGYLALFAIYMAHYLQVILGKNRNKPLYLVVGALAVLPIVFFVQANLQNKFSQGVEDNGQSAAVRYYDTLFGIKMIGENPIVGIGLDADKIERAYGDEYVAQDMHFLPKDLVGEKGITNGFISAMVMWGIPFFIVFAVLLYRQQLFQEQRLLIFVVTILFLIGEPLFMSPFIAVLLVSAFRRQNWQAMNQFGAQYVKG